jgi:hypothetical protein
MPVVGTALLITDHVLRGGSDAHGTCMMHPDPRVVDVESVPRHCARATLCPALRIQGIDHM